jgi:hypothetical protein
MKNFEFALFAKGDISYALSQVLLKYSVLTHRLKMCDSNNEFPRQGRQRVEYDESDVI